jgi:hypothetical protein
MPVGMNPSQVLRNRKSQPLAAWFDVISSDAGKGGRYRLAANHAQIDLRFAWCGTR